MQFINVATGHVTHPGRLWVGHPWLSYKQFINITVWIHMVWWDSGWEMP